jgi:hypothetical protein
MMIVKLSSHFPLRVTDWLVALIAFTWGFVCLQAPAETWELPIYDSVRIFAGQGTWGSVVLCLGLARIVALFINGAYRRTPHARMVGAFLMAFVWLQLSFAMFQQEYHPIAATAIYPWLFLADIYNVYRAAQDAKVADCQARVDAINNGRGNHRDANRTTA